VYPRVGTVFDRTCSGWLRESIDPRGHRQAIEQAAELRPQFQTLWDTLGGRYVSAAFAAVGRSFPYREMQAVLTVCPVPTMSNPLLINVRDYLPSNVALSSPSGDFAERLFHELMHHYTSPVLPTSFLRQKYSAESPVVLSHLHVMALELTVLGNARDSVELHYLENLYRTDPAPGDYRRAWQIVRDEGPSAFVAELRACDACGLQVGGRGSR